MSVCVTITCPNEDCEEAIEIECEYEPADPSVGYMRGAAVPSDDVPVECPECETKFTPEQIAAMKKAVVHACEDWRPNDDGPEYDPCDAMDRLQARSSA